MLNSKHRLGDSELFEELDDRLSEKISGGFDIELTARFDRLAELSEFGLLQPDLLTKIQEQIDIRFPQVGEDLALGCTSTQLGIYNCEVSAGGKTESFVVDINQ